MARSTGGVVRLAGMARRVVRRRSRVRRSGGGRPRARRARTDCNRSPKCRARVARVSRACRRPVLALMSAAVVLAAGATSASAASVRFVRIGGVKSAGTPARYDRVGILQVGSAKAKNVLVLNPGTSASAAYFQPLAKSIVARAPEWQGWAVGRRENPPEDHSGFGRAQTGRATAQQVFDYYLGWLDDPSISPHFQLIPDAQVGYARDWGMNTEIQDLRRVVQRAERRGGKVVMGGHSLGGSITAAYATWDFNGRPGARGLAGLIFIDGGSSPTPVTSAAASTSLKNLRAGTPWLIFGGIPAPF